MILAEAGEFFGFVFRSLHLLRYFDLGKDATEAFEDVGHSDEARDVLNGLYIGEFDGADVSIYLVSSTTMISSNTP